jgi:hypothetical protein
MTRATLPDGHAQIGPIWRGELHSTDARTCRIESIALSHDYLPPSTLIGRPAIVSAAPKDGSVIGLHPGIGQIPRGYYPCGQCADQPDRCRPELGQACLVRRDRQP